MNKLLSDIAGQGARNKCNFSPWEKKINVPPLSFWSGGRGEGREEEAGHYGGMTEDPKKTFIIVVFVKQGWFCGTEPPLPVTEVRLMLSKADRAHP